MTLDDIAALEVLHAKAATGPWEVALSDDGYGNPEYAVCSGYGDPELRGEDRATAEFMAAAATALPDLLALARRALEADARPGADGAREMAAAECRRLGYIPPEAANGIERLLWRVACDACAERIEAMEARDVSRPVLADGERAP